MSNIKIKRKQLLYRSTHRGCKETDILIGSFAENYISSFTEQELAEYEQLLDIDDSILYDLICQKEDLTHYLKGSKLIELIINFNQAKINGA